MASLLNDEVRREHYAVCREQRIKCEKLFSLCGGVMVGLCAADIISSLYLAIWVTYDMTVKNASHLVGGWNLSNFGCLILSLAICVTVLLGVHARKTRTVLIGLILSPVRVVLEPLRFFTLAVIPIVVCFLSMRKWDALSKEDGFPQFDISFDERKKRAAQMERITKHMAIETGKRRTAAPDAGEMSDLLDTAGDTPVAAAELSGYHDRSRHGQITESGRNVAFGDMDEL
ncbi:MAG: hypothetical protein IK130_12360 [Oscillospiraceae bacterium]|nr:hypothetical protein [Oscillospiraceae bacterium]